MENELCIRCGKPTPYHPNIPITLRCSYVEGSGQLCPLCYQELYGGAGSLDVPFGTDNCAGEEADTGDEE
jgi:hypothetical protein